MIRTAIAALLALNAASASADEAKTAYNNHCRTCHSLKDADNRLGPHLAGLIGRAAGTAQGYPYSSALKGAGIVWTKETLDAFLARPDEILPGNNMNPYPGIADPAIRALIVKAIAEAKG